MDRLLDELAERIAEAAKEQGMPDVYDSHEQRSYENYRLTAEEAGLQPESYENLKAQYEPFDAYKKALLLNKQLRE